MNFFFGMKHLNFHSEIQIPCFQNRNPKSKKLLLYEAWTENNQWVINRLNDCKLNDDFYIVKNNNNDKQKVKFVIDHVKQLGGIEYAHAKMIEYRDKALVVLHSFPPSITRDALEELVRYTTDRKY